MDKQAAGLRKRQQISRANKTMFLAIAGASTVVGFSLVLVIFLGQRILFGEKVIAEKDHTISVLQKNIDTVPALKDNIRVLNTNQDLASVRLNSTDAPLQSVLDALPSNANSTAMASSLQTKLLAGVPGVTIESLRVDSASSDGTSNTDAAGSNTISFSFAVSTASNKQTSLRSVLQRIEMSIRPFDVTNLSIESQGGRVILTANGVGYYDTAQTVQLTDKVVKQ